MSVDDLVRERIAIALRKRQVAKERRARIHAGRKAGVAHRQARKLARLELFGEDND